MPIKTEQTKDKDKQRRLNEAMEELKNVHLLPGIEAMELKPTQTQHEISSIGKRLIYARVMRGYGQTELADIFGVNSAYICRVEKGIHKFNRPLFRQYIRAFQISQEEFAAELRNQKTKIIKDEITITIEQLSDMFGINTRQVHLFVERENISPVLFFPENKYLYQEIYDKAKLTGKTLLDEALINLRLDSLPGIESISKNTGASIRQAIGFRLRMFRKKRKKRQSDIVNAGQLSPYILSEIEWGFRVPSMENLQAIARGLGTKYSILLSNLTNPSFRGNPKPPTKEEITLIEIGGKLRQLRLDRSFSVDSLAGSGIAPYMWMAYEYGRKPMLSRHVAVIAKVLKLTEAQLKYYLEKT